MTLVARLETAFAQGGFSLDTAFSGLTATMAGFTPSASPLDIGGLGPILSSLGSIDASSIASATQTLAQQGKHELARLADPVRLLDPVLALIESAERFTTGDAAGLLERLRHAGDGPVHGLGLSGLEGPLARIAALGTDPVVGSTVQLVSALVPGVDANNLLPGLTGHVGAVRSLIALIGALMGALSQAMAIAETARAVAVLLPGSRVDSLRHALAAWAAETALPARIAAADPTDAATVNALAADLGGYLTDLQAYVDALERGFGFGEAALTHARVPDAVVAFDAAATVLTRTTVDPIRALALSLRARLAELLPGDFGAGAPSFAGMVADARALVGQLGAAIAGIDAAAVAAPIMRAIGSATAVVRRVTGTLDTVQTAIHGVFETARQIVSTFDVRPIADAIRAVVRPLADAIEHLDALVSGVVGTIQAQLTAIIGAITTLKASILDGTGAVREALERVHDIAAALDLDATLGRLRGGVQDVADTLSRIQLEPYFAAAIDVTDTIADILSKVPMSLLPDDARAKVDAATATVRAIDFDGQVREPLVSTLDGILDDLDTEVLAEIQQLYEPVLGFLSSIDPGERIQLLETAAFDPILARLRAIDPEEMLRPVARAIDTVKKAVDRIDVRARVLSEVQTVFDTVLTRFDELDPATLLQPLAARIDAVRTQLIEVIGIDHWAERVTSLQTSLSSALDRFDLAAGLPRLESAYASLVDGLRGSGEGSILGSVMAALLQGTLDVRPSSFRVVTSWLGGADGAAAVRSLLADALDSLRATRAAVDGIDPAKTATALMPFHRAVLAAVESHPADSVLRLRLGAALSRSPLDRLAPAQVNRPAYVEELDRAVTALTAPASSDLSQLTAATAALHTAFGPLAQIKDRGIAFVRRFGIDPLGKDAATVLGEVLAALRPSELAATIAPLVATIKDKLADLVADALVDPVLAGVAEIEGLLARLDLTPMVAELHAQHAQVRGELAAFSPTVLLGEVLGAFDRVREHLSSYDPLAPVRAVLDAFKAALAELGAPDSPVRPTVMLEPAIDAYREILRVAGGLDVRELLRPVLDQLDNLSAQLGQGLGDAERAFKRLQDSLAGSSGSASASVSAGAA